MAQQRFASILDVLAQILRTTSISFATIAPHTLPAKRSNPRKPSIFYNPYPEFSSKTSNLPPLVNHFRSTKNKKPSKRSPISKY